MGDQDVLDEVLSGMATSKSDSATLEQVLGDVETGKLTPRKTAAKQNQKADYPGPSFTETAALKANAGLKELRDFSEAHGDKILSQIAVPPGSQFLLDFMIHQPFTQLPEKIAKEITDKNNRLIARSALYNVAGTTWDLWKGATSLPQTLAQDPGLYAKAGAQAAGETLAAAIPEFGAGVYKGATFGAVDLEKGTIGTPFTSIRHRVMTPLPEALKGIGVSPEIADAYAPGAAGDLFGNTLAFGTIFGALKKFVTIPLLTFSVGKKIGAFGEANIFGEATGAGHKNYAFLHLFKEKAASVATAAITGGAMAAAHVRGPSEDIEVNMLYGATTAMIPPGPRAENYGIARPLDLATRESSVLLPGESMKKNVALGATLAGGLQIFGEGILALKEVADIKKIAAMIDFKNTMSAVLFQQAGLSPYMANQEASKITIWAMAEAGGLDKVSEIKIRQSISRMEDSLRRGRSTVPETSQEPATEIPQTSSRAPAQLPAPSSESVPDTAIPMPTPPRPPTATPNTPRPPRATNPIVGDISKVRERIKELSDTRDAPGIDREALSAEMDILRTLQLNYEDQAKEVIFNYQDKKRSGGNVEVVGYPDGRWTYSASGQISGSNYSGFSGPFSWHTYGSKEEAVGAGVKELKDFLTGQMGRPEVGPIHKKTTQRILSELEASIGESGETEPVPEPIARPAQPAPSAAPVPATGPIVAAKPPSVVSGQPAPKTKPQPGLEGLRTVISKRATLPVLTQVKVQGGKMSATDLEMGFTAPTNLKDGMYQIIGKELAPVEGSVEDFPVIPRTEKVVGTIDKDLLIRELDRASQVVSTDQTRYILTGAKFTLENGVGRMIGTNGKMMSESFFQADKGAAYDAIIPNTKKIVKALRSIVPGADGKVTLSTNKDGTLLEIGTPDNFITTKLIEGNFPNVEQVRPYISQQASVPKDELDKALKELAPYVEANGADGSVRLDIDKGALRLTTTGKAAEKTVSVPATIKKVSYVPNRGTVFMPIRGEDKQTHINPAFLAQASKNVRGNSVYVGTDNWLSPVHVYGDDISLKPELQDTTRMAGARAAQKKGTEPAKPAAKKSERFPEYAERGPAAQPPVPPQQTAFELTEDLPPVIELPELVQLGKEVLEGKYPKVNRRLLLRPGLLGMTRIYPDKILMELSPVIFKTAGQAARTLGHEIGHVIDALPDYIIKRGNILGRLFSFKRFMAPVVEELFKAKEIRQELVDLTMIWKPFTPVPGSKNTKYRLSGPELYADAISVLFNNPSLLKKTAPKFYQAFFEGIDSKPVFKDAYKEIVDLIKNRGIQEKRYATIEERYADYEARLAEERKATDFSIRTFGEQLRYEFWDSSSPVLDRIGGQGFTSDTNPDYAMQEMAYSMSEESGWLRGYDPVIRGLKENGFKFSDLGKVLEMEQVINSPLLQGLAQAGGFEPKTAQAQLDHLRERLGNDAFEAYKDLADQSPHTITTAKEQLDAIRTKLGEDQYGKLQKLAQMFRDNWKYVLDTWERGGMESYSGMKILRSNPWYVTRDIINKRIATGYGPSITPNVFFATHGSLDDIGNPATAAMMKGISMIHAVNRKMAMLRVIRALQQGGEEVTAAAKRWNGKFMEFVEPKNTKERRLLMFRSNGEMVGYEVPADIHEMFYRNSTGMGAVGQAFNFMTVLLKDIFTGKNPAFWTKSAWKDFWRFVENSPGLWNPANGLKYWLGSIPSAVRLALNMPDSLIDQMLKRKMLLTSINRYGHLPDEMQHEALLRRYQSSLSDQRKISGALQRINVFLEQTGKAIEAVTKIAGFRYLRDHQKELGIDDRVVEHMVREQPGNPNYARKGANRYFNVVLLFANPRMRGMQSDIQVFRDRPAERTAKFVMFGLMPKILEYMFYVGAGGYVGKRVMRKFSQYYHLNYQMIPLWTQLNGKSVAITLPQTETDQFLTGAMWLAMVHKQDGFMADLASFVAGQAPSQNPLLQFPVYLFDLMTKTNPYDWHARRSAIADWIYQQKDYRLIGNEFPYLLPGKTLQAHLKFMWGQYGGNAIMRMDSNNLEENKSTLEKTIGVPIFGGPLGAWVRVSDYGVYENMKEVIDKVTVTEAREKGNVREAIIDRINMTDKPSAKDAYDTYLQLLKAGDLKRELRQMPFGDFLKLYETYAARKTGNQEVDALESLGTDNRKRAVALAHLRAELDDADFSVVFMEALRRKLLNPEVIYLSGIDVSKIRQR